MTRTGEFRYVPYEDVEAYQRRGWLWISAASHWRALMWHCLCGEVEP